MSTVGYGNVSPVTPAGRALTCVMGFVSILVFLALLALAGSVVRTIYDDFVRRTKLYQLRPTWVNAVIWCCLAYLWMLVMAWQYQGFRSRRLQEPISLAEGYWFAWISSTTVGLGGTTCCLLEVDSMLSFSLLTVSNFLCCF